ncbi:MAG: GNAT family N-acetyltransferase [Bacteroidales bacterium]
MNWMEWIGYAASAFILLSMLMTSIVKLRFINLIGSLLFVVYGLLIEAYPVAFMNFFIALVNIYYIIRIRAVNKNDFSILEVRPDSEYVREFLKFYAEDIKKFIPLFSLNETNEDECWLLLKDMKVAGIFMGRKTDEHTLFIDLDYILKQYRDFRIGTFLYKFNQDFFLNKDIHQLKTVPASHHHNHYLKKMGFQYQNGYYERSIK